ncbi:hypothetical protein BsWGS_06200 [Bradybaena similaris]
MLQFAEGPLIDGLYWDKWYNGEPLPPNTQGYIYYENRLLGVPRMRQLRVSTNSCIVNEEFESFISDCYAMYSERNEDKNPFGRYVQDPNETAWLYHSAEELEGYSYWGKIDTYGGGGFLKDLDLTKVRSQEYIAYLKNSLWIQRGARAVFISFTVYNANINLFCIITLLVEFPATGGAIPSWAFNTVKLIRYVSSFDYFIMACEIIFVIFIAYYTIEEIIEIVVTGLKYFLNLWNVLDVTLVIMSIGCIGFNIYRTSTIEKKLESLLQDPLKYANFDGLGFWEMRFNNLVAVTVFFAWVKIFKYISFNKTMTQLSTTLSRCAKDLLGFFIMFFIVFLAFTQLGYLLFGTQVQDFSTFMNSFFTLFRIILGDFNFYQLEQANRILGPIFFMLFVFFVFFVLINMFLAIINDTYSEVKSDMAKQTDLFIMSDYLKQGYSKMWSRLGTKRDQVEDYEKILSTGKKIHFIEWKKQLLEQNFDDDEIEEVFAKYDVDGDRYLDPAEQQKMLAELVKLKNDLEAAKKPEANNFDDLLREDDSDIELQGAGDVVRANEFLVLNRRVDRIESTLTGIMGNIEKVLSNLADS